MPTILGREGFMNKSILTKREKEIFKLLISISNTMQKLGVKGRANAVVELLRLNEISL